MTAHKAKALDHLAAVEAMKDQLDAVRREPAVADRARRIDRISAELHLGIKLALVHAVLDVADAFRDWTSFADEPLEDEAIAATPAELLLRDPDGVKA